MKMMEQDGLSITECTYVLNALRRMLKENKKKQPLVIQENNNQEGGKT